MTYLQQGRRYTRDEELSKELLFRTAVANVVMTAALLALQRPLPWWLESSIFERVTWLATAILVGVGAYFAALLVLGLRTADFRLRQN